MGMGDYPASMQKPDVLWKNTDVGRTISTPSIADGLIYQAEYAGILHCLDAETGEVYWTHDSYSRIWGSTPAC